MEEGGPQKKQKTSTRTSRVPQSSQNETIPPTETKITRTSSMNHSSANSGSVNAASSASASASTSAAAASAAAAAATTSAASSVPASGLVGGNVKGPASVAYEPSRSIELQDEVLAKSMTEFQCWGCRSIVWQPEMSPCFHLACKECLNQLFDSAREQGKLLSGGRCECPTCRTPFKRSECKPLAEANPLSWRMLSKLRIYCPDYRHMGCEQIIEYSNAQDHLDKTCKWSTKLCTFCNHRFKTCEMEAHGKFCDRLEKCSCCKQSVTASQMKTHLTECSKVLVECPNKCESKKMMYREDVLIHRKTCPFEKVKCSIPFCSQSSILRRDLSKHIKDEKSHLDDLQKLIHEPINTSTTTATSSTPNNSISSSSSSSTSSTSIISSGSGTAASISTSASKERVTDEAIMVERAVSYEIMATLMKTVCSQTSELTEMRSIGMHRPIVFCEKNHIMPLTFGSGVCSACGIRINAREPIFECKTCKYNHCLVCYVQSYQKRHQQQLQQQHQQQQQQQQQPLQLNMNASLVQMLQGIFNDIEGGEARILYTTQNPWSNNNPNHHHHH
jgi:hypothetical protein